jgi:hypothetical protein
MEKGLYEVGDRVSAEIPGGVTVNGPIVEAVIDSSGAWYNVEQAAGGADDGQRYEVREDEIKVVLDSESE